MSRTRIAIHQPNFAAWIGFFYKIMHADVFVVLDNAQYSRRSFQNRNKVLTPQGPQWLTVPVLTKGKAFPAIREVELYNGNGWRREHAKTLEVSYRNAPYFERYATIVQSVYDAPHERLADLNVDLLVRIMRDIGLTDIEVVRASDIVIDPEARRTERLVQLCEALNADVYISGAGAQKYQDESLFAGRRITLMYAPFTPFTYPQRHAAQFYPHLSILDYLFNCGGEQFRRDISRVAQNG